MTGAFLATSGTTLTPVGYRKRITETEAQRTLGVARALLVEGPKGCGKTWFAKRFARSEVLLGGWCFSTKIAKLVKQNSRSESCVSSEIGI